jgi:hypothetical protein
MGGIVAIVSGIADFLAAGDVIGAVAAGAEASEVAGAVAAGTVAVGDAVAAGIGLGDLVAAGTSVADLTAAGYTAADMAAAGMSTDVLAGAVANGIIPAADAAAAGVTQEALIAAGADPLEIANVFGAPVEAPGIATPVTGAVETPVVTETGAGSVTPGAGDVASVEVTPGGDVVNGVQTGANPTGVEGTTATETGAVNPAETTTTTGTETGTTTATSNGVTDPATGNTTYTYDDGSTLTTDANGNVVNSTDINGVTQAPVVDAGPGTPGTNNPYGTGDIPLGTAIGDLGSAVAGTLGTTGLLAAGALTGGLLAGGGNPTGTAAGGNGYLGESPWSWGKTQDLVKPGLNPGYIGATASQPFYKDAGPNQTQYYWGVHPYAETQADLANYNNVPNAPTTPYGPKASAVGGTNQMNIGQFVNSILGQPYYPSPSGTAAPGGVPNGQVSGPVAPVAPEPVAMP